MTDAPKYRRLPGRSGLLLRHSLWLGPDHLLRVRAQPFSEEYRRYYFKDIQALVVTELPSNAEYYGYGGAALLLILTAALFFTLHPVLGTMCGILAAIVLLWSSRRADCACYVRTRVSTDRLQSLKRRGNAQKAMGTLKALIAGVQGETLQEAVESFQATAPASSFVEPPKPPLKHHNALVHWLLFSVLLLRAAMTAGMLAITVYSMPVTLLSGAVSSAVLLLGVMAAFQQYRTDLALGIRRMVYIVLAWYALSGVSGVLVGIYAAIRLGPRGSNPLAVQSYPVTRDYELIDLGCALALASIGLFLLWRHQRASDAPPPLALGGDGLGAG